MDRAKIGDVTQFLKDRGITEAPTLSNEDAARITAITHAAILAPKEGDFQPPEVEYGYQPAKDEILLTGTREFCNYNLARVRSMIESSQIIDGDITKVRFCITDGSPTPEPQATPTEVIGSDAFQRRIAGLPEEDKVAPFTDVQYRAALKSDDTPEPVKKAIRKYFADRDRPKSTAAKFIPVQKNFVGRNVPFVSEAAYKRPAGMSGRQFRKSKKEMFRALKLVTATVQALQSQ